jgi:hypothetical protein
MVRELAELRIPPPPAHACTKLSPAPAGLRFSIRYWARSHFSFSEFPLSAFSSIPPNLAMRDGLENKIQLTTFERRTIERKDIRHC